MNYQIKNVSDNAIAVYFDNKIEVKINQCIQVLKLHLDKSQLKGILTSYNAYQSLMILFDPLLIKREYLRDWIQAEMALTFSHDDEKLPVQKILYEIPVLYEGEDLSDVAVYNQMTIEDVIVRHSAVQYYIYFLGFSPGFPYLGGLDYRISTPRKITPRLRVEPGSVGIADTQTGIYTMPSPGGWNLIGKVPVAIFDYERKFPFALEAGNFLKFKPIKKSEYDLIKSNPDYIISTSIIY